VNPYADCCAVVIGAGGGIGGAIVEELTSRSMRVFTLARGSASSPDSPTSHVIDTTDEASIEAAAAAARGFAQAHALPIGIVVNATGFLHGDGFTPEKNLRQLDATHMAKSFAVNAMGPALVMKHFLPLLRKDGPALLASLSAKVGSIGDNQLGGWYSYRASKAALNQFVHTAAIELKRGNPTAICVAIHPGTVDTKLSSMFAKSGLNVRSPDVAAKEIVSVLTQLRPEDSGGFFDYQGKMIPW
jgi:NAD(P)-dependent dehydrogenase (short-subunit alcohol dehydrogenase family)